MMLSLKLARFVIKVALLSILVLIAEVLLVIIAIALYLRFAISVLNSKQKNNTQKKSSSELFFIILQTSNKMVKYIDLDSNNDRILNQISFWSTIKWGLRIFWNQNSVQSVRLKEALLSMNAIVAEGLFVRSVFIQIWAFAKRIIVIWKKGYREGERLCS